MTKNVDFDLDDPLGDLLSDNSNDSFFNDDKQKSDNKSNLIQSTNLSKKKSNLFGLESEQSNENIEDIRKPNKSITNSDWLGLTDSQNPEEFETKADVDNHKLTVKKIINKDVGFGTKVQSSLFPARSSFPDSLNFLDELGLSDTETDANKTNEKSTKKSSMFDDILGKSADNIQSKRPETPNTTATAPQKNKNVASLIGYSPSASNLPNKESNSKPRLKIDQILTESKQKTLKTDDGKGLIKSPVKQTVNKRQRGNADWLGIFPDDDDVIDVLQDKKELPQKTTTEWLKKSEAKVKENISPQDNKSLPQESRNKENSDKNSQKPDEQVNKMNKTSGILSNESILVESAIFNIPSNLNFVSGNDIGQQSAAICLQQQESQLMVALQLKAQEERLAALREHQEETQRVQREVVSAQRQQVDCMLQGQADHRAQLQTVIHQHQQRINKHIQSLLMPSPTIIDRESKLPNEKTTDDDDGGGRDEPRFASSVNARVRLTTREQLEQMIDSLRENHTKEIDLIETSYRRQIQIVDESLQHIEERLKTENDKMSNYFALRIEKLEEEKFKLSRLSDERIQNILQKHSAEREATEKKHQNDIAILQEQHRLVIQNIKETLLLEQSTIRDSTDYSQKLNTIMQEVQKNNEMCSNFVEKMESKANSDFSQKEQALNAKEDQLHHMLDHLERQRSMVENESCDLKAALKFLEERLRQQTELIEEDKMGLKKKALALEIEKDAFRKESETLRGVIEREKEIIDTNLQNTEASKIAIEKTVAEKLKHIEIEKLAIANDKLTIENLKTQSQALKVSLQNELEEVMETKKKISFEQQKLQQSEMKILARSQELESLTRSALAKHANAERRISEADYAQRRYQERLKRMQEQAITLNSREQQIARDKVTLSRERLMLYNQKKEIEWSPCGLCNADKNKFNITKELKPDEFKTGGKYNTESLEMAVSRDYMINNNNSVVDRGNIESNDELLNDHTFEGLETGINGILLEQDIIGNDPEEFNRMIDDNGENLTQLYREIVDPKSVLMKFDIRDSTKFS